MAYDTIYVTIIYILETYIRVVPRDSAARGSTTTGLNRPIPSPGPTRDRQTSSRHVTSKFRRRGAAAVSAQSSYRIIINSSYLLLRYYLASLCHLPHLSYLGRNTEEPYIAALVEVVSTFLRTNLELKNTRHHDIT